jgi:hypothetical protein
VPEGVITARSNQDPAAPEAKGPSEYFYREFAPAKEDAPPPAPAPGPAPNERP